MLNFVKDSVCRVQQLLFRGCDFYSLKMCEPSEADDEVSFPKVVAEMLYGTVSCPEELFPFMFYFTLVISLFGVIHNIIEFLRVLRSQDGVHPLRMWRPRQFAFFTETQLRRCRVFGQLLMIVPHLMLLYGVVKIKPQFVTPWLTISSLTMAVEGVFVIIQAILQCQSVSLRTGLLVVCPVLNTLCAACVRTQFEKAYEASGESTLTW